MTNSFLSNLPTKSVAPATEDLSPFYKQTASGTYTEPTECTLHPPSNLPNISFDPIFTSMHRTSNLTLIHGLSHQKLLHFSLLSYAPPPYLHDLICLMIFVDGYKM
jgi:hypothetical protein